MNRFWRSLPIVISMVALVTVWSRSDENGRSAVRAQVEVPVVLRAQLDSLEAEVSSLQKRLAEAEAIAPGKGRPQRTRMPVQLPASRVEQAPGGSAVPAEAVAVAEDTHEREARAQRLFEREERRSQNRLVRLERFIRSAGLDGAQEQEFRRLIENESTRLSLLSASLRAGAEPTAVLKAMRAAQGDTDEAARVVLSGPQLTQFRALRARERWMERKSVSRAELHRQAVASH